MNIKVTTHIECCGRKPYDHVRNICCKDVLLYRPANAACCYNSDNKHRAYNTLKQVIFKTNLKYKCLFTFKYIVNIYIYIYIY